MGKLHDTHICLLIPDPDGYKSNNPPNATCWRIFYEKWIHVISASSHNPRTADHLRSRAALRKERLRHDKYPGVVHPFSRVAMAREIVMFFVWSMMFMIDPIYGTFMMTDHVTGKHDTGMGYIVIDTVQWVLSFIVLFDIILNFFLGYVVEQTREVVLDRHKIVRRYAKTYFLFDFIAMVNAWIPHHLNFLDERYNILIHQLFVFRLVRVYSLSECFVFMLRLVKVPETIAQCANIMLSTIFILNWLTCLLAWVPLMTYVFEWSSKGSWTIQAHVTLLDDVTLGRRYMTFLLMTVCHFYAASTGYYVTKNVYEYTVFSVIIMVGIGYYTYAVAVVSQLFRTDNISETMYIELVAQVNQFASNKKLSPALKNRLLQYYEAKFQRRFFNEYAILHAISEHLRFEVILYSSRNLIENVYLFQGVSKSAVGAVLGMLTPEIYLPGDEVTGSHLENSRFHIISYGTLSLLMRNRDDVDGKEDEIMHFEDGDICGNLIFLWLPSKYAFRTVVLERTEIFSLSRRRFDMCKRKFPELNQKANSLRDGRRDYVMKLIEIRETPTHEGILQLLNQRKILLHGRKRTSIYN